MSITAMKQALEALELMYACYAHPEWISHKQQEEKILAQCVATTMALRQAIEQAEKQEPVAWNSGVPPLYPEMKDGETISVEYTTPPAAPVQQQKPVCWDDEDKCPNRQACCDAEECLYTTPPAAQQEPDAYGYAKRLAVAIWEQHYKGVAPQWKPFDDLLGVLTQIDNMTAGLTDQRQPLTDEQISDIAINNPPIVHVFARAIEAAHGITGEKNHGQR